MRKIFLIAALVFGALAAFGQTDNTLYARNFPGSTVGLKITAAQNACDPDTAVPCIIVIDPTLAVFPTGTLPAKCPNCVWLDYRTINGVGQVGSVTGSAGITCSPTSGSVLCSLNAALPNGETATTQSSGDTSTQVATDQFVTNQINAVTGIYYGSASAVAATDDNVATFASVPLTGSVTLYQNDVLVPPLDYNVDGNTLTLNGFVFEAGAQITAYWQTYNANPGGMVLTSNNYLAPAIRQTTRTYFSTACSTCEFPIPPLAQPGDMVAFIYSNSANILSAATGFTSDSNQISSQGGAGIVYGVLTAAEIATGTVQVGFFTTYNPTVFAVDFSGPTGGYLESDALAENNATSITESTSTSVAAGDVVLPVSIGNSLSAQTLSPGTTLSTYFGPSTPYAGTAQIYGYFPVSTAGANSFTATYSTPNYIYLALFVFKQSSSASVLPSGTVTSQSMKITTGICTTAGAETLCVSPSGGGSYSWPVPFPDANYAVQCGYVGLPTGTGTNPGLYGPYVVNRTATGFQVEIQAGSNSAGGNNTVPEIDCRGNE